MTLFSRWFASASGETCPFVLAARLPACVCVCVCVCACVCVCRYALRLPGKREPFSMTYSYGLWSHAKQDYELHTTTFREFATKETNWNHVRLVVAVRLPLRMHVLFAVSCGVVV